MEKMDVEPSAFHDVLPSASEGEQGPPPFRVPDLPQCPWYHGPTTRIASEMSLARDMDFLVRDCISSPGDYVLTTRWRGQGGARADRVEPASRELSRPLKFVNIAWNIVNLTKSQSRCMYLHSQLHNLTIFFP